MKTVLESILLAFIAAYWWMLLALAWLVVLVVGLFFWPFLRDGLQTRATTSYHPRGDRVIPRRGVVRGTNWCGCCGRRAPDGAMWCFECVDHVDAEADTPAEATWSAQWATPCPYTDLPDEPDPVPEGLGWQVPLGDLVHDRRRDVHPLRHPVVPLEQLTKSERALWEEVRRGVA